MGQDHLLLHKWQMREPVSEAGSRWAPVGHMIMRVTSCCMAEPTDQPIASNSRH